MVATWHPSHAILAQKSEMAEPPLNPGPLSPLFMNPVSHHDCTYQSIRVSRL
jgi:hypothetical protein